MAPAPCPVARVAVIDVDAPGATPLTLSRMRLPEVDPVEPKFTLNPAALDAVTDPVTEVAYPTCMLPRLIVLLSKEPTACP